MMNQCPNCSADKRSSTVVHKDNNLWTEVYFGCGCIVELYTDGDWAEKAFCPVQILSPWEKEYLDCDDSAIYTPGE